MDRWLCCWEAHPGSVFIVFIFWWEVRGVYPVQLHHSTPLISHRICILIYVMITCYTPSRGGGGGNRGGCGGICVGMRMAGAKQYHQLHDGGMLMVCVKQHYPHHRLSSHRQ